MSDQAALLRALMRLHLASFTKVMFKELLPGEKLQWNWHLDAICYKLEQVARGECRRLIIEVPPRSLKSVLSSVMLPAWLLGRDPTMKIIAASYSLDLAIKHHNDCRDVMRSPRYGRLFPGTGLGSGKDTETEFHTLGRGVRYATSPSGTLTGRGGDLIILDDIMSPAEASSDAKRETVHSWYTSTALSRINHKQTGAIIVVAQRLHIDDLPGRLREQGGWDVLSLPAISPADQRIELGADRTRLFRDGEVLHPEREPLETLDLLRRDIGSRTFSAQYLQQPVPVDGDVVKRDWFKTYDHIPLRHDSGVIQSWDIGMTAGPGSDWSVCMTWQRIDPHYYLRDVARGRWEYPELLRKVPELARQFRADTILIEDMSTGTALIQHLRAKGERDIPLPIACKPVGDKLTRLINETPAIEAGHVWLPRQAPWLEEFHREFAQFPNGRHDDQVDSLSQFLGWVRKSNTGGVRVFPLRGR